MKTFYLDFFIDRYQFCLRTGDFIVVCGLFASRMNVRISTTEVNRIESMNATIRAATEQITKRLKPKTNQQSCAQRDMLCYCNTQAQQENSKMLAKIQHMMLTCLRKSLFSLFLPPL